MGNNDVLLSVQNGIATLTLNRPDEYNPAHPEMMAALEDKLDDIIYNEDDIRCVVVQGAGDAFSAGGDLNLMDERKEMIDEGDPIDDYVLDLEWRSQQSSLYEFPLPTVAKVDGPAVGHGANLALSCDIQLASDDAKIGFSFRNPGLCIDGGGSYLLTDVVGRNKAKELVFTGKILDAEEAADLGIVNHVYPREEFDEKSDALIQKIATGPTTALRHSKRLINNASHRTKQHAGVEEAISQGIVWGSDDHAEGIDAFNENRDPEFSGR